MKSVSPNLYVNNILESVEFYKKLGFNLIVTFPETENYIFAMMTCGDVTFMFQTFESLGKELPEINRTNGGSLLLYIQIENIRNYFEKVNSFAKILKPLETTFYGATEFSILDPNGYVLTFAEDE